MKNAELKNAIMDFQPQIHDILKGRQGSYKIAKEFREFYTIDAIRSMPLDHYALGNDEPKDKSPLFCYTIEHRLKELGKMSGSTSIKFGVYKGIVRTDPTIKYRHAKKYGTNYQEAFNNIKEEIIDLLHSGKRKDIEAIISNKTSPMFKGKILTTFFPKKYLNIFSDRHLNHFLVQLNLDDDKILNSDAVLKRERLLEFKNKDSKMKSWTNDIFMYFLYHKYPKGPLQERSENDPPIFPIKYEAQWVNVEMLKSNIKKGVSRNGNKNPNYELQAKSNKLLGNRGEKIVFEMEKKRLAEEHSRPDLVKKVKQIELDSKGYDIESIELDGKTKRYIEVKSTTAKVGETSFFISKNEFEKAKELDNYQIYIVYEVKSTHPKVCILGNPFNPQNKMFEMTPISYKVNFKTKQK